MANAEFMYDMYVHVHMTYDYHYTVCTYAYTTTNPFNPNVTEWHSRYRNGVVGPVKGFEVHSLSIIKWIVWVSIVATQIGRGNRRSH